MKMKIKTQSGGKNNIDWGSVFTTNKEQLQIELSHSEPINYWMDEATLDKYLKSKSINAHTSDFYKKEITAFGSFLDALGLIEATLNECNRYLVARRDEVSPGSARVVRGILVGYGKYLDANGMISGNPFAKTSEKELRITKHDSEAATKKRKDCTPWKTLHSSFSQSTAAMLPHLLRLYINGGVYGNSYTLESRFPGGLSRGSAP